MLTFSGLPMMPRHLNGRRLPGSGCLVAYVGL